MRYTLRTLSQLDYSEINAVVANTDDENVLAAALLCLTDPIFAGGMSSSESPCYSGILPRTSDGHEFELLSSKKEDWGLLNIPV